MSAQKHKRSAGQGSLRVRQDKAGRESFYGQWRADGRLVKRVLGPKRTPGTRDGLTRPMAERRLQDLMANTPAVVPLAERMTVKDAGERLLTHLAAMGRKRSTLEGYESALRVHLVPGFSTRSLDKITRREVQAFVMTKLEAGLSANSVNAYCRFLFSIFEYGVRQEWCTVNPVRYVDRPRAQLTEDIRYLTMEEVEAVRRAVPDDDLGRVERVVYLAAFTTGMRQGELVALRWCDVDWAARRIRVRRNYVRGEFGTPKSKRSSRSVPLTDRLAGELDQLAQTSSYTDDDALVFGHPHSGHPLDRSKLRKRFVKAVERAGVRRVRFHDLRHSFATLMAAEGTPMRTLQELMGHSSAATTEIYADFAPSGQETDWAEAAFGAAGDTAPALVR